MLRHRGVAARVRCGFASYFAANHWEDHWLCEYWHAPEGCWRRADAQLDPILRHALGIEFEPANVPETMFITAGEAWRRCRDGRDDSAVFGHGTTCGLWFVRVNVMRDHYALNDSETSEWDGWRNAIGRHETLSVEELERTDVIALQPEAARRTIVPPWKE